MYTFSAKSKQKLLSCDLRLQALFNEVITLVDCTVLEGHRTAKDQDEMMERGLSKLAGGSSKHNLSPSLAVDVAPYPIDWKNLPRFIYFGGIVMGVAAKMKIPLRWGGDWNANFNPSDETFLDYVHFELK
jgi:peptidoglycan L-alanyl-D-glutamate endopeptidase CwlK